MNPSTVMYRDIGEEEAFQRAIQDAGRLLPGYEIEEVFRLYRVSEAQLLEIIRYLSFHAGLARILVEAVSQVDQVFGQAPRYLELDQDPDGGDEELFCVILVKGGPEQALELLRQFDEWFSGVTNDVRTLLNFTVDTEDDESI